MPPPVSIRKPPGEGENKVTIIPGAVTIRGTKVSAPDVPSKCCTILGTAGASDTIAIMGKKAATAMVSPCASPAGRRGWLSVLSIGVAITVR